MESSCHIHINGESEKPKKRRKLRVMIISLGGDRQKHMEELFSHPVMVEDFEPPVYSSGVPSRNLRSRYQFLKYAYEAGLIPDLEWQAIHSAQESKLYAQHPEKFFDCLAAVPVTSGRRGSETDVTHHYSVELWQKAKSINRGRAVFGCTLAHLIALKQFVAGNYDVLLEDNVRAPPNECANRIWQAMEASDEYYANTGIRCHLRYLGWLGSIPNLQWIYKSYLPQSRYQRSLDRQFIGSARDNSSRHQTISPSPTTQDIIKDLAEVASPNVGEGQEHVGNDQKHGESDRMHTKPGGNPVWGCYGYWMSKDAYTALIGILRNDVGSFLWKGKRMRFYSVKPIDKILPRQVRELFGAASVQITSHPAFFRAPMLTSKIHKQWDPEFCKSTELQLLNVELKWENLWLTDTERLVVKYYEREGIWLTWSELMDKIGEKNGNPMTNEPDRDEED